MLRSFQLTFRPPEKNCAHNLQLQLIITATAGVAEGLVFGSAVQQMRAETKKKKGGVVRTEGDGTADTDRGNSIVIRGTNVSLHLSFS